MLKLNEINTLLLRYNKKGTEKIVLQEVVKFDTDMVYEIDYNNLLIPYRSHDIFDSHDGWVILTCFKGKKRFFHVIQAPNKQELFCRWCLRNV